MTSLLMWAERGASHEPWRLRLLNLLPARIRLRWFETRVIWPLIAPRHPYRPDPAGVARRAYSPPCARSGMHKRWHR